MDFFIVRDAATGLCMPFTKKGQTHVELADPKEHPPRLFTTKRGASLAITAWLKGVHKATWSCDYGDDCWSSSGSGMYVDGITIQKKANRARTQLEVVKAYLHMG